jgi:glycyl-tRNA synthetase
MTENTELLQFHTFLREQAIIWPESMAGHYTYGVFGKKIKNQLEQHIRQTFNHHFDEIETPLIYPKKNWKASGHWDKFHDPIVKTKDHKQHRLDKLIEEQLKISYHDLTEEEIVKLIPKLGDQYIPEIHYKNLMMTTSSGKHECALRPETATTTFLCYKNLMNHYKALPFFVYQIGKAFRNEPTPKNNLIRTREFSQAEGQIFISEKMKNKCPYYDDIKDFVVNVGTSTSNELRKYKLHDLASLSSVPDKLDALDKPNVLDKPNALNKPTKSYYFWLVHFAYKLFADILPNDKIRLRQHEDDEKAFYALDAWDVEVYLEHIGWTEICGVHDRGNYDLKQHNLHRKTHILEIAIGVDRLFYSLLDSSYDKKLISDGKSRLLLPYNLAPYKIAVLPLVKNKPEIVKKSREVYDMLQGQNVIYKDKGSVGKRYLDCSLLGVPYCITIDYQTLEDDTVTLRDRDNEDPETNQIRIKVGDVKQYVT